MAEQVSILAGEREVSAKELAAIVPDITKNLLPALAEARYESGGSSFTEREILYKLIFDLKHDLQDLKQFVYGVMQQQVNGNAPATPIQNNVNTEQPLIISQPADKGVMLKNQKPFDEAETVEDSLSLADMEKEVIIKAMKKHKNRRKEAAADLGISERTLYRKLIEYNIKLD